MVSRLIVNDISGFSRSTGELDSNLTVTVLLSRRGRSYYDRYAWLDQYNYYATWLTILQLSWRCKSRKN